jgi:hypothetical protein
MAVKPQYSSFSDDISQQFDSDWSDAENLYRKGVDSGYSENDADQLYLQPIRDKYKIVESSPELMQNPDRLEKFHTEYDNSLDSFYKSINTGEGYTLSDAFGRYVKPVQEKWVTGARLPAQKIPRTATELSNYFANAPDIQDEDAEAQAQIEQGQKPQDVLEAHPMLLKVQPWRAKWLPIFKSAEIKGMASTAKQNAPPDILKLGKERKEYQGLINENNPESLNDLYRTKISGLEQASTNAPSIVQSGIRFQPPQEQPSVPQESTPKIPTINSQEEYNALPEGAQYKDSNGKIAVKKHRK